MVTVLGVALYVVLVVCAGGAVAGLMGVRLSVMERVLCTVVFGLATTTTATFLLALPFGLGFPTVVGGGLAVIAGAMVVSRWCGHPITTWASVWRDVLSAPRRLWWRWGSLIGVTSALFGVIFARSLIELDGNIDAGYQTVWADWAQHLTTASSFTFGHNLPPMNSILSGQALLYPFLPDFHSAMLMTLGVPVTLALALPGAVLAIVVTLLIVCIAQRLGATFAAGVIAAVVCFLGGGIGFVGIFHDACVHHGYAEAQCSLSQLFTNPGSAWGMITGTLHDLPAVIAAQPRAYDGLLTASAQQSVPNIQWYTPLLAWWIPQRSLLWGFSLVMTTFVIVLASRGRPRAWTEFALAAVLIGLLPLMHVHSLIAFVIVLPFLMVYDRRREWIVLCIGSCVVALPRLLQLMSGEHGSALAGNTFPWILPGWLSADTTAVHTTLSWSVVLDTVKTVALLPVTGQWWVFWLTNLGVVLPLCVVVAVAAIAQRFSGHVRSVGTFLLKPFPPLLVTFCLPFIAIFVVANVVVPQSWAWDNTKLFVYWYFAVALLVGVLATAWWTTWWRRIGAAVLMGSMVGTGTLAMMRFLPWTPTAFAVSGPYVMATTSDRAVATAVEKVTAPSAVFLTSGRHIDPVSMLAGRPVVQGYAGWLWSYGIDYTERSNDVAALYAGCSAVVGTYCDVPALLHKYHVSYVELDDRTGDPGAVSTVNVRWWSSRHLPVIVQTDHIVIYDVRTL